MASTLHTNGAPDDVKRDRYKFGYRQEWKTWICLSNNVQSVFSSESPISEVLAVTSIVFPPSSFTAAVSGSKCLLRCILLTDA